MFVIKYFLWNDLVLYKVDIDCYTKAVCFYIVCRLCLEIDVGQWPIDLINQLSEINNFVFTSISLL